MKKLKIRKETLFPLDHRLQLNEAAGGSAATQLVHTPFTLFVHAKGG
jgi:hypothetical protein